MKDCNTYTVQAGDTLSQIGEWFGVRWQDLQKLNHIENPDLIFPGQEIHLASNSEVCKRYLVRSGDTLSEIGQRFGVTWDKLAHYNHIGNPDLIHPGETVCIPAAAHASEYATGGH